MSSKLKLVSKKGPHQPQMRKLAQNLRNLSKRPALWALGTASTSDCIGFTYASRLLLNGERRNGNMSRAVQHALVSIDAQLIGRASTIGRPWKWRLKQDG